MLLRMLIHGESSMRECACTDLCEEIRKGYSYRTTIDKRDSRKTALHSKLGCERPRRDGQNILTPAGARC